MVRRHPAGEGGATLDGLPPRGVEYTPSRLAALGRPVRPAPAGVRVVTDHPLSLLQPDEVESARSVLVEAGELPEGAAVVHIVLDEPAKDELAAWAPGDPVERRVRALVVPGPELTMVEVVISIAEAARRRPTGDRGHAAGAAHGRVVRGDPGLHEHPEYVAALARRGITDLEHVQIDPVAGRRRSATAPRRAGASPGASRSCARADDDNGYARPIEGLIVHVDLGGARCIEVIDHAPAGRRPDPARAAGRPLRRRRRRPAAHRPAPDRDHPARRPELHRRGQPRPLAEVVAAPRVGPLRGPGAPPGRLRRRRGRTRSILHRASISRDGRALRRPRRGARAGRTPSTPGSGASGA